MTTINKLTRTDTVSAGDIVPVYVQSQGDARGASMTVIAEFVLGQIELSGTDFVTQYALPAATGFSVQVNDTSENTHLILAPTGVFAAGTIVLPMAANLIEGQQVMVTCTQVVTALTVSPNGSSIIGSPTTLAANQTFLLKYDSAAFTWYMVGNSVSSPATTNTAQTFTNKTISGGVISGSQLTGVNIDATSTGDLTLFTGLPIMTGVAGLGAGVAQFLATPTSAALLAAVTNETGLGALVFNTNPSLVNPALGTPSAVVLTNGTGLPISTGVSGLAAGVAAFLAAPSSANMLAMVTDETGTGLNVFNNGPTLIAPALGTPASAVLTNATGLPISTGVAGLGANVATFLGTPSSANLAAAVADETGAGALVFNTGCALVTPFLGAASAESLRRGAVVTQTGNFSVGVADNWITCNGGASITVTLPTAGAPNIGREIMLKTIAAFTVVSASANVVPLAGGAAGTAILAATPGAWATLVSDGTNWVIMQA